MATYLADNGRAQMVKYCAGTVSVPANFYGSWGTGTGVAKADTTFKTEGTETRVATTRSSQTGDTILRHTWTMTCNATGKTIQSGGWCDTSSGAPTSMGVIGDFTGIAVVQNDSIAFTADLTFTN